jgi:hypothetical protein
MIRRIAFPVALALVIAAPALAHDQFRIIGTVITPEAHSLSLKTKDGKTLSVRLVAETVIWRDEKKGTAADLKAGANVVIDAWGDSEDETDAVSVRIVPTIMAPAP